MLDLEWGAKLGFKKDVGQPLLKLMLFSQYHFVLWRKTKQLFKVWYRIKAVKSLSDS